MTDAPPAARWLDDPILKVEHLTMRFGGLIAVNDLVLHAGRGDITALIGPNGAGKTTVFNCITGFYKPTEGRIALRHGSQRCWRGLARAHQPRGQSIAERCRRRLFLLERMPDFGIAQKARVARTFQNIRLFAGMTVLENLLVAQHNALMRASGFSVFGLSACRLSRRRARGHRQAPNTGSTRSSLTTGPTIRPATCPTATSAGSRSPARCAPIRCCSASTSRPPASTRARAPSSTSCCAPSATSTTPRSC